MKNLIGKEWLDASNGHAISVLNPATNEVIDTIPDSSEKDVDHAAKIAFAAQKKWANMPMYERGEILKKFVELVEEYKDRLAALLSAETGKPIREATIEVEDTKLYVNGYIEKAKHLYGINIPMGIEPEQEKDIQYTVREPLGVIACIIPFNFPCDLFGQKVPPALIMGNSVIIKPSSYSPLTLTKYVELLLVAGVPEGVVNIIHGEGKGVGQALAAHSLVQGVSFTGSTDAGMEVMKVCSNHLDHVMLELGGNDAFILLEDGDIDLAVEETINGRLYNTGQVCCASKRFLIHNSIKEEYIQKLIARVKELKVGMPSDAATEVGCLITEQAAIKVESQVRKTLKQGARLIHGGRRNRAFFEPTILDNVTRDMDIAKDMEVFGPVIPIIGFDTIEEAIEIANQSVYGLNGNVITKDMKKAFKVASELQVGGAIINGSGCYRTIEMPFGGWKYSGFSNEGIATTLEEMSHIKTIVLKNIFD